MEGTGRSRNYFKCHQCRNDGKKCLPEHRGPLQRCQRCTRLGHLCGPPERARRGGRAEAEQEMTEAYGEVPSPTQQWMLGYGANFGHLSLSIAISDTVQRLFMRAKSDVGHCLKFEISEGQGRRTESAQRCHNLYWLMRVQLQHLQDHQMFGIASSQPQRNMVFSNAFSEPMHSVDPESGDFFVTLCTANILKPYQPAGWPNQGHVRNSVFELPAEYYKATEVAIRDFMASISRDSAGRWSLPHYAEYDAAIHANGPFPASFIAYWNLDREVAFKLWESESLRRGQVIDVLGRDFAHIVAEAGDSQLLTKINWWSRKTAGRDARGLSLLDLAIIGDSAAIVEMAIAQELVQGPFTQATQRAIVGGRVDIAANHLVRHLTSSSHYDFTEINFLADLAGEKGFSDLQVKLEAVNLQESSSQQAIGDLDNLYFHLGSDEAVIPDDSLSTFSDMSGLRMMPSLQFTQSSSFGSDYTVPESPLNDQNTVGFNAQYAQPFSPS